MDGILLDLDGVVYVGDDVVPGAAEAIAWLRRNEVPHRFLTNTSSRPRSAVVARLAAMGVEVDAAQVLTPAVAAASWIRDTSAGRPALFVPDATATEFSDLDPLGPEAEEAQEGEEGAGCVVVGDLGPAWTFQTLNRALRLLLSPARPTLVALGMTRYWRAPDGLRLDAGAFVRALEYAAGTEAVVLGKPAADFYARAVASLGVPDGKAVVMVGDDIRTDVEGAQRAGLKGVLVRTGKFSEADLEGDVSPDGVLDSLADLPAWWSQQQA